MKLPYIKTLTITAFFTVLVAGCTTNPVSGKKELILLSEQQEIQMGREADPVITKSFGLYEDPEIQEMITRMGRRMASISHRPDLRYEFKILDSPTVNAFAVPGGYVYFTRGIMAHFNSEAEFAGVLGHEIGHIAARHSAQQYTTNILAQAGLIAGVLISPEFAQFSGITQQALGLLFLKFSRDDESESDWLGVRYSTDIGFDAHQMADFFQTIDRLNPNQGGLPFFLSTHPNPQDRFSNVHTLAEEAQAQSNFNTFEVNRDAYLELIDGIVYGLDPRQGYVEGNVFYHPNGRYKYPIPANWKSEITPQQSLFAPDDGEAIIVVGPREEASLQAAASATVKELNLTSVDQRMTQLNGLAAIRMTAVQVDPNNAQIAYPFLVYFIDYGNTTYRALGVTTPKASSKYSGVIDKSLTGFSRLTDQSKLNVQPDRIKIVTATQTGTLKSLLFARGENADRIDEIALINGMTLEQQVEAGTKFKVLVKGLGS